MLADKTIVLGITGSIAAYKAADIASKLVQAGASVEVVMTESAIRFIAPLTLRSITGRPVVTSMWELSSEFSIEHVALAEAADVVVIAPATANTIAIWPAVSPTTCLPAPCWQPGRRLSWHRQ